MRRQEDRKVRCRGNRFPGVLAGVALCLSQARAGAGHRKVLKYYWGKKGARRLPDFLHSTGRGRHFGQPENFSPGRAVRAARPDTRRVPGLKIRKLIKSRKIITFRAKARSVTTPVFSSVTPPAAKGSALAHADNTGSSKTRSAPQPSAIFVRSHLSKMPGMPRCIKSPLKTTMIKSVSHVSFAVFN